MLGFPREHELGSRADVEEAYRAVHQRDVVVEQTVETPDEAPLDIRGPDVVAAATHPFG